jgi:hypothetical protein
MTKAAFNKISWTDRMKNELLKGAKEGKKLIYNKKNEG